jgi:hypothetical protein
MLVKYGADPFAINYDGEFALTRCIKNLYIYEWSGENGKKISRGEVTCFRVCDYSLLDTTTTHPEWKTNIFHHLADFDIPQKEMDTGYSILQMLLDQSPHNNVPLINASKDYFGRTALDKAIYRCHNNTVYVFKQYIMKKNENLII